ncbi:MAG: glycoside hydrolase family 38 C-terminal domain-containing protein [Acidobacteriota bacterium]
MGKPRCYFIGNTHVDHTWTWNWTEGYDEVHASFRAALQRMREFPEFVFTCASSLYYRWVEENDPGMFEEIKLRVAEGRWQVAGGWVVQSDNNIPCGEAFVRQGLYGQRYFLSRFGRQARVGYCVDSFGHHAQLPQILRLQGMEGWVHFRPEPAELQLPAGPYWWRGIDGTEVLSCRPPGSYRTPHESSLAETAQALWKHLSAYPEALFFYGVGDHGGGPTKRDLRWMRRFRKEHPEVDCRYGGLDEFYREAARKGPALPRVQGELQYTFRGCYTTNGLVKSLNRKSEGRLLMAEIAAALAAMTANAPYPRQELDRAWDFLLTNHFHDVICGACTQEAMEEAVFRFGAVLEAADRVRHTSLKRLTARFDRRPPRPFAESLAFSVANSLSWDRSEPLEFHPFTPGRDITAPALVDASGKPLEFQMVEPAFGPPASPGRMLFTPAVPAGGAALFHVVDNPDPPPVKSDLKAKPTLLENRRWRIRIDAKLGTIRSLFDKRRGVELVPRGEGINDLLVLRDLSDTWGTGRNRFGARIGRFTAGQIRVLESGPLRARIEIRSEYRRCTAVARITLYRDFDYVDFSLEALWNDKLKAVKIAIPLALERGCSLFEIPYGAIERPLNGEEQPMQRWLLVRGRARKADGNRVPYAVGIVADSVGGADIDAAASNRLEIRLTLLRSPYHASLTRADAEPHAGRAVSDQGLRRVRYRLVGGGRAGLGLPEHGAALSQPLQVAVEGAQAGALTRPQSFFRCQPASVHLTSLKMAENGEGFVARLVETRGRATAATVSGPKGYAGIKTTLRPFEIQTWRWLKGAAPILCDLLENRMRSGTGRVLARVY